jgi:nucleoside-diphosphate-sugar epimerase
MRKTVLITGASGFIGRKLAASLLSLGNDVHGTSRTEQLSSELPITWHQASFDDIDSAQSILDKVNPQIIFHLAGMVTGSNTVDNVLPTYHSLVTSTVNLLTVAATTNCERIVIVGSSNEPLDQYANSPYSAAKWASCMYGRLYQRLYNLPVVIAKTFVAYGPGQPPNKLVPYVVSKLLSEEQPELSSGTWRTDWIYIDDVVDALVKCGSMPGIEGETIDIGTGAYASVRDVVDKLVAMLHPTVKPLFGALPDRHLEHTPVADTRHAWKKIHWRASISLEEGLKRTVEFLNSAVGGNYKMI